MSKKLSIKFISTLIIFGMLFSLFTACGAPKDSNSNAARSTANTVSASSTSKSDKLEKLEFKYQGSAGQVNVLELAADLGYLDPIKLNWVGNTISGPQDIQATASGDVDIGGAFTTAVINLVAANSKVKWVIGAGGVDSKNSNNIFALENSTVKTAEDFIGKTVAVNTLGAHNEVVIKLYLKREGLTDADIKKVSLIVVPPANTEQALRSGQVDLAFMGGIFKDKALEKGGVRSIVSDRDIIGDALFSGYVMRDEYIKENPNTSKKIVEGIAKAIEWSKNTPGEEVVARMEKIIKNRGRNESDAAVKYWKSYGIASKGGLTTDKDIQTWLDWLVQDGKIKEGQFKPSDIYTNELNTFIDK